MSNRIKGHKAKAEALQDLLLDHFQQKLMDGTISAGEVNTLTKLLSDNGWTFDPSELPQDLKEKLTLTVDPRSLPTPEDFGFELADA